MDSHKLIPFLFETDTLVRITDQNGEPWFIAADICRAIGIKNHRDAVAKLDEDEKGVTFCDTPVGISDTPVGISDTSAGPREHLVVSESGLYCLILRSHAAITPGTRAHRFRRWVTAELIPSVRKTGQYATQAAHPQSLPGEIGLTWGEKCRIVEMTQRLAGSRAAAEKMLALGFAPVPSLLAMLRQGEFRFVPDLDDTPPAEATTVN